MGGEACGNMSAGLPNMQHMSFMGDCKTGLECVNNQCKLNEGGTVSPSRRALFRKKGRRKKNKRKNKKRKTKKGKCCKRKFFKCVKRCKHHGSHFSGSGSGSDYDERFGSDESGGRFGR